jgi:hypothetical protein
VKTLDFYAWCDVRTPPIMAPVHDTVIVVLRSTDKLTCFRLDLSEAQKALNDLAAAIVKAQSS